MSNEEKKLSVLEKIQAALENSKVVQEEINAVAKKNLEIQKKSGDILEQQQLAEIELAKSIKEQEEIKNRIEAAQKRQLEQQAEYNAMLEEFKDDTETLQELQQQMAKDNEEHAKEMASLNEKRLRQSQKIRRNDERREKLQKESIKNQKELDEALDGTAAKAQGVEKQFSSMSAALGGMVGGKFGAFLKNIGNKESPFDKLFGGKKGGFSDFIQNKGDKATGKMGQSISNLGQRMGNMGKAGGKLNKVMGGFGGILGKVGPMVGKFGKLGKLGFNPYLIAAQVVYELVKALAVMGNEVDTLSKQIAGATGYASDFHDEIIDGAIAGNMSGVGFKEMASSITALADGMSTFLPENEATNTSLALTVGRLEKFGIAGQQSVSMMDYMQRGMGLSAQASADLTANIARMGKTVGITAKKAVADFIKLQPMLSRYGKDNVKVFKKLQAQAKATGMSVESLVNSVKKFDTFEGAAEQASQLNAVLGTTLSGVELMQMDEADRINMIRQQVQASVGNFDSLDKFTKQYIADAMGVKDVAEAQRMLNMSTAEYSDTLKGQQESANIQAELADATEKLVPFVDQLKLGFTQLMLSLSPVIEAISKFLRNITPMLSIGFKLLGASLSMLFLPINLVAKGLALLYDGGYAMWNMMDSMFGPLTQIIGSFTQLFNLFGSVINPPFIRVFHFLAEGIKILLSPLMGLINGVGKLGSMFGGLFGIMKDDADTLTDNNKFDITAMAKMDTSKMASGFSKVKESVAGLANVEMGGLLMAKPDGTSIMAGDDILESVSEGKLQIDVKMPKQEKPNYNVVVKIGETELKKMMMQVTGEALSYG